MAIPVEPGITSYSVYVARVLNDAYAYTGVAVNGVVPAAAPNLLFAVPSGTMFRSPGVVRRGWGRVDESNRGLTRIMFDMMDYHAPAAVNVPHDQQIAFLIVRPFSTASGALLAPDRVYVVPPPDFYSSPSPALTLSGSAPNTGVGTVAGDILAQVGTTGGPPGAMHIVLPRFTLHAMIQNLDPALGNNLLVSFDVGNTCSAVPGQEKHDGVPPSIKNVLLEGQGAVVPFTSIMTVSMGQ